MIRFGVVQLDEELVYNNGECSLKINSGDYTKGTLLMTASDICWKRENSESGFMIPWEKVTVQAITQEPQRVIYFMIDTSWPEDPARANQNGNGDIIEDQADNGSEDEGNDSDCSLQEFTEFHIRPDESEEVDTIYYIMTKFPEVAPMEDSSDDDFFDGDNMEQMNIHDNGEDNDQYDNAE